MFYYIFYEQREKALGGVYNLKNDENDKKFFVSERAVERNVKFSYFTILVGVTTKMLYVTKSQRIIGQSKNYR